MKQASAHIEKINFEQAQEQFKNERTVFVDVRDRTELHKSGTIPEAQHAARGMLGFLVDSDSPLYNKVFAKNKKYIVYCASGGRSVLVALTMKQMGFAQTSTLAGGFKEWQSQGGDVEPGT